MKRRIALALLFVLSLSHAGVAKAASSSGVTISPPFQEVSIRQNQAQVAGNFVVANNNQAAVTFEFTTVDMGALNDSGGVVFSGLSADYQKKYGLAQWLHLPETKVTIPGKSTKTVDFVIVNDPQMTPGGHYGAVIIKPQDQSGSGSNQVSLNPQAATLLFVRKIGGETFKLGLETPKTKTYWWRLPSQIGLTFRNEGNVHLVPRGVVAVKDPFGNTAGKSIINPESSLILPEHTRLYRNDFVSSKKLTWPGVYKAEVRYRYDGTQTFSDSTISIRFVNLPILIAGIVLAGLILWAIFWLVRRILQRRKNRIVKPAARNKFMSLRRVDGRKKAIKSKKK